jgi:hypothetical protein
VTDRWTPAQLSSTIRWVLKLEYAGGTWYMTDEAMTIDDGTGGTIVLTDGLLETGDTVESIDLWATEAPRRSSSVAFDLGIDVATLIEEGHDLAGCMAELAQLADGDPWTARRPFVRGRLVEPQYGAQGEGVQASIEQDVLTDESEIRTVNVTPLAFAFAQQAVTGLEFIGSTSPSADENVTIVVPAVLGTPGGGLNPGTIATRVETFRTPATTDYYYLWLIAGHAVDATTVTLRATDGTEAVFSVQTCTLDSGEVVSFVVDFVGVAVPTWTNTTEAAVVLWTGGGGLVDQNYGPLRYAGDYVAWLLSLTEQDVDHARVNLAREQLRAYEIATYLDEPVTVSEYIREVILDILPVSMMVGPRGVYPYVWRWDATSEDAVASWDLTTDLDIARESVVTYEDADRVANTVQLLYGWAPRADTYTREMWAVGDPASRPRGLRFGGAASLALSYWSDPILARSTVRYGVRRDALETAIVHDDLTASRVLAWRSRRWALPSRVVEYSAPQTYAWVEPGDYVTVTDPDLAWTERLCLVQSRAWAADGSVRYTLRVQEG